MKKKLLIASFMGLPAASALAAASDIATSAATAITGKVDDVTAIGAAMVAVAVAIGIVLMVVGFARRR